MSHAERTSQTTILSCLILHYLVAAVGCSEDNRPNLEHAVEIFIEEHSAMSTDCGLIGNDNCNALTARQEMNLQCFLDASETCKPRHIHISSTYDNMSHGSPFDRWYFVLPNKDGTGCDIHILETPVEPRDYLLHERCISIQPAETCFMIDPQGCVHVEIIEIDRVEDYEW